MIDIKYPNIQDGKPEDQIRQIKSYLYQLADMLNYAISQLEKNEKEG